MPEEQLGLRERKKADTRRALSDAALELMFERGLENVVREDIAARAGVSVRTFNNYFSGKFDALAYRQLDRIRRGIEILGNRPADEPLWDTVTAALVEPLEAELMDSSGPHIPTREQLDESKKLLAAPEMRAMLSRGVEDDLIAAVAARTGIDPERSMYPRLVVGAMLTAQHAALEAYVRMDPPEPITDLLRQALAALAAGLPQPPA
ncbi:TetR/AcrR family transcriptional regulator [Nocardia sp. CDC153]|uniref:TetR/AcrR family transcriptional regulator n=1 Tax=Nocardia sp. CDC153 TaxID=3112167 RepID=UPI002DB9BE9F|nr:TetR/AcrR family transcriptional regulator [Nocardia sp. CDC153]MEC3952471.1 TetR/AcrR family transcriptional regulator [Nocardia sp. CDC153]